ncbi:MAG: hypothetical protein A3I09_04490, partial [Deltaproteobacteria bacterium RIFCSPLOWO2_02_FULL_47_10]
KTLPLFDNQLMSIKSLSKYLDVPAGTIRDWIYKRQIPYLKAGRLVRFNFSDIRLWLEHGGNGCQLR